MPITFAFVVRNKGIDTEVSYPYENRDNATCRFQAANVGGTCMNYMEIQEGDEEALRQAVATGEI